MSIAVNAFLLLGLQFTFPVEEIKQGDCLEADTLTKFLLVAKPEVYYEGACKSTGYAKEGQYEQKLYCGETIKTGTWSRTVKEHNRPGDPFEPAKCMASVLSAKAEHWKLEDSEEHSTCDTEGRKVLHYQTEELVTKKFTIFSGELHLPWPAKVHREFYTQEADSVVQTLCENMELWAEHTGWGNFKVKFSAADCGKVSPKVCKMAKLKASQNSQGETCALVTEIKDCPTVQ